MDNVKNSLNDICSSTERDFSLWKFRNIQHCKYVDSNKYILINVDDKLKLNVPLIIQNLVI